MKLNGKWYHIDPTWDDPTGGPQEAVSGYECHYYFGLPDEIMAVDHSYSPLHSCTAYECNYFIRSGRVDMWVGLFEENVNLALMDKKCVIDMEIPEYYPIEIEGYRSKGKEHIVYPITAYAMSNMEWYCGEYVFAIDAEYDDDRMVEAKVALSPYTLNITQGVKDIEAEAFENNAGYLAVVLPEGVENVGERAFAGCGNLWKITIPDSLISFSANALEGCGNVTVFCNDESPAAEFEYGDNVTVIVD